MDERIISRIRKLIALAESTNSEEEAAQPRAKPCV